MLSARLDLLRDGEGGTTDALALDLDAGCYVLQGFFPHLDTVLFGLLLNDVDGSVENFESKVLLAFQHDVVDEFRYLFVIVLRIRKNDPFFCV